MQPMRWIAIASGAGDGEVQGEDATVTWSGIDQAGSNGIQSHAFGKGGPLRGALMLSHVEQRATQFLVALVAPTLVGSTARISSLAVTAVHCVATVLAE